MRWWRRIGMTGRIAAYYMVNCAHPSHFSAGVDRRGHAGRSGMGGIRANASCKSHAELD
jgi:homocysteine S-methyltransferase